MSPRLQQIIWEMIPEGSMGAIRSAINMLDIVLPGLLTMLAVWVGTSISIPVVTIFLAILLSISTVFTLRTSAY